MWYFSVTRNVYRLMYHKTPYILLYTHLSLHTFVLLSPSIQAGYNESKPFLSFIATFDKAREKLPQSEATSNLEESEPEHQEGRPKRRWAGLINLLFHWLRRKKLAHQVHSLTNLKSQTSQWSLLCKHQSYATINSFSTRGYWNPNEHTTDSYEENVPEPPQKKIAKLVDRPCLIMDGKKHQVKKNPI